jgi:hypothetical protein
LQVSDAVTWVMLDPPLIFAVSVTAPSVGPRQVASPFVLSFALLIFTCSGSETVQAGVTLATHCGVAHPGAAAGASNA